MQDLIGILESLGRPRVALLGDFVLDAYVYGECDSVSPEAPVPVLKVVRRETRPGGAGAVAAGILAAGGTVSCIGVVGQDASGEELVNHLMASGAETASLIKLKDHPTTTRMRLIGLAQKRHQQQMMRVDHEPAGAIDEKVHVSLRAALRGAVREASVLAVADYGLGVLDDGHVGNLLEDAASSGAKVIIDPARLSDYRRYRGATVITPNRAEAELAAGLRITDEASLATAADRILADTQGEAVVITLAAEGAYLKCRGGDGAIIATQPRDVYDVTGAGEAVLSMLAVAFAGGADVQAAVALANVAAGLEIQQFGWTPIRREKTLAELIRQKRQIHGKVVDRAELMEEADRLRAGGKAVVFTNGCFDILHAGHVQNLNFARRQGDVLVVAINSDDSIRRLKGPSRPIVGQADRAEVLAGLECVDYVTVYDEDTPIPLLEQLRPDVLVKGAQYDQPGGVVGREVVEAAGGRVVLAPMLDGRSSTDVIARITEVYGQAKQAGPPSEQ